MTDKTQVSLDEEVQQLLTKQGQVMGGAVRPVAPNTSTKTRLSFIRKVYGLLTFQLTMTFGYSIFAMLTPSVKEFMIQNAYLAVCAIVIAFITFYLLFCFIDFQRRVPHNYIAMLIFIICESYAVAFICITYTFNSVILVGGMVICLCTGLTLYAIFTKTDFTLWGGFLAVFGIVFVMAGVILLFFNVPILIVIFNAIGIILFGIYLVYDTQLILGNKSANFSIDDYMVASLSLYIDIINIFLDLLSLFGKRN